MAGLMPTFPTVLVELARDAFAVFGMRDFSWAHVKICCVWKSHPVGLMEREALIILTPERWDNNGETVKDILSEYIYILLIEARLQESCCINVESRAAEMDAKTSTSDLVRHEAEQPFDQMMVLLFHKNVPCCSKWIFFWRDCYWTFVLAGYISSVSPAVLCHLGLLAMTCSDVETKLLPAPQSKTHTEERLVLKHQLLRGFGMIWTYGCSVPL